MKIAVLGATGPSGLLFTQFALEGRHQVVCLVRNPGRVTLPHQENLIVRLTNVFSQEDLAEGMEGCDCVCSCLGAQPKLPWKEEILYSQTIKVIYAAMQRARVTRFVCLTAALIRLHPSGIEPFFDKTILRKVLLKTIFDDMERMEDWMFAESAKPTNENLAIQFTILRPTYLRNKPFTENILTEEGVDWMPDSPQWIPRENVARLLLDSLEKNLWINKAVLVTTKHP